MNKDKLFLCWKMSKSVNITAEGVHDFTSPHFVSHSNLNEHCGTLKSAKKDLLSYPKQNAHIAIAKVELSRHAKKASQISHWLSKQNFDMLMLKKYR